MQPSRGRLVCPLKHTPCRKVIENIAIVNSSINQFTDNAMEHLRKVGKNRQMYFCKEMSSSDVDKSQPSTSRP